jgi:hypothetical protein
MYTDRRQYSSGVSAGTLSLFCCLPAVLGLLGNTFCFSASFAMSWYNSYLGTGGDRNVMQLKLALQDFGFMVALVVTECVLQYSLALSNLLKRPSIDLRATDSILIVASILLVYQQAHCLCAVAYQLSSVCSVIHSAFRQVLLCPGTTPGRSVYYPLLDHIANELETRLVVPKDRFLAQYLIPSKLASLTPERELQVFMPFAGALSFCLIFRRLEITVSASDAASTKSIEGLCKRLDNAKLY